MFERFLGRKKTTNDFGYVSEIRTFPCGATRIVLSTLNDDECETKVIIFGDWLDPDEYVGRLVDITAVEVQSKNPTRLVTHSIQSADTLIKTEHDMPYYELQEKIGMIALDYPKM